MCVVKTDFRSSFKNLAKLQADNDLSPKKCFKNDNFFARNKNIVVFIRNETNMMGAVTFALCGFCLIYMLGQQNKNLRGQMSKVRNVCVVSIETTMFFVVSKKKLSLLKHFWR